MLRQLAALAVISSVAFVGCGGDRATPSNPELELYLATTSECRDKMCACKDADCAKLVNNDYLAWVEAAGTKLSARMPRPEPSTEQSKRMVKIVNAYSDCMRTANNADAPLPRAAVDAAPTDTDAPFPAETPVDLDKAIRSALDWGKAHRDSAVASIKFEYVDATGTLDRDYGALHVTFGFASEDDPKRRIGAPIFRPEHHEKCFQLTLRAGSWTRQDNVACAAPLAKPPACRVKAIWAKAIAKGAPKEAVARIDLWSDPATWRVAIEDKPRRIDFSEDFPDDCPVMVEEVPK